MAVDSVVVRCGACQAKLDEDPNAPAEHHRPCPQCGSVSRHCAVGISGTVAIRSKLTAKGRHPGERQHFVEQTVGDDLHRKTGRWMKLNRVIDRFRNWYHERVTDPARGQVIHECDEPLTEHKGHGSAKPKADAKEGLDP